MNRIKITIPWLLAQLGVRKWLSERALHVPEADVASCAAVAGVSVEQWRGMENVLVSMLYDGITRKV